MFCHVTNTVIESKLSLRVPHQAKIWGLCNRVRGVTMLVNLSSCIPSRACFPFHSYVPHFGGIIDCFMSFIESEAFYMKIFPLLRERLSI